MSGNLAPSVRVQLGGALALYWASPRQSTGPRCWRRASRTKRPDSRRSAIARRPGAHQHDSSMGARGKPSPVREVEILRDEKALFLLCGCPYLAVVSATQLLGEDGVDIVSQGRQPSRGRIGDVLVQLDPHSTLLSSGPGRAPGPLPDRRSSPHRGSNRNPLSPPAASPIKESPSRRAGDAELAIEGQILSNPRSAILDNRTAGPLGSREVLVASVHGGTQGGMTLPCSPAGYAPPVDSTIEGTFGCISGTTTCQSVPSNGQPLTAIDWIDTSMVDGFTLPYKATVSGTCTAAPKNNTIDCTKLSPSVCPNRRQPFLQPAKSDVSSAFASMNLNLVNPSQNTKWAGQWAGCYAPGSILTMNNWGNAPSSLSNAPVATVNPHPPGSTTRPIRSRHPTPAAGSPRQRATRGRW